MYRRITINERQSPSGFGVSYSLHSIPGWKGASHGYSRMSYFTRTTNEPSRRQNSEVSTPNRLTVARHPPRTHIRSREVQTRQEYSRNYGRGHRFTPAQARGPIRAKGLQPHSLSGFKWKHTPKGSFTLTGLIHTTYKLKFASTFSSAWGSLKPASGNPRFRGSTKKAHRELKGMTFSYSHSFRQVRSGWD